MAASDSVCNSLPEAIQIERTPNLLQQQVRLDTFLHRYSCSQASETV